MAESRQTIIHKMLAITLVISFSNAPLVFAQSDASAPATPGATPPTASAAPLAPVPAPAPAADTSAAAPAPTDSAAAPSAGVQSAAAAVPASSNAPSVATTSDASVAVNPQGAGSVTVQDTYNGQTAVSGDSLLSTADPQSASSTDPASILIVAPDASSSDAAAIVIATSSVSIVATVPSPATAVITSTSSADIVVQDINPNATSSPAAVDPSAVPDPHGTAQTLPAAPVAIPLADLVPGPAYSFALSGDPIPTTATDVSPDGTKRTTTVDTALAPVLDNASSTVTVSGQCSDDYFVVLLYAKEKDYSDDPSSYILNKAYPCVGGTFTYSITDLPHSLASGTYYLLVGQEGKTGAWKPITALSPITISGSN